MTPVKNRDLWQRIDHALTFHAVEVRNWRVDGPADQMQTSNRRDAAWVRLAASARAVLARVASAVSRVRSLSVEVLRRLPQNPRSAAT
jgi:hypothetical protein